MRVRCEFLVTDVACPKLHIPGMCRDSHAHGHGVCHRCAVRQHTRLRGQACFALGRRAGMSVLRRVPERPEQCARCPLSTIRGGCVLALPKKRYSTGSLAEGSKNGFQPSLRSPVQGRGKTLCSLQCGDQREQLSRRLLAQELCQHSLTKQRHGRLESSAALQQVRHPFGSRLHTSPHCTHHASGHPDTRGHAATLEPSNISTLPAS
jgi:hypothetical protein